MVEKDRTHPGLYIAPVRPDSEPISILGRVRCARGENREPSALSERDVCSEEMWVFTQMTQRQNFDATSRTVWTVFLMLSIGCYVKLDARALKFVTPASKNLLCENPQSNTGRFTALTKIQ